MRAPWGSSKKLKGSVVLGVDDLGKDIREATSHLVSAFNELAEAVPPEKVSGSEDLSPEEVVVELCSQMAKVLFLSLIPDVPFRLGLFSDDFLLCFFLAGKLFDGQKQGFIFEPPVRGRSGPEALESAF